MAANGESTSEDAEMSSLCGGDAVVTMMDVLQEQQDFEDDANAVLGASDDKNCTYSKGYVKRQAIYACLTCCPEAKVDPSKRAGVCLACSLNCHENHELIELYTKRNFSCDCGNPKFNSHPCTFTPNKNDLNYENKYNQNFNGIYCVCHRPYPDPEAIEEEEMLQCIVCEDWLHTKHLEATVPHSDLYEEMICKDCMEEYDFLHDYSDLVVNVVDKEVVVDEYDFDFDLKKLSRKGKSKKTVTKVDIKSDKLDDKAETVQTNGEEKKNEDTAPASEKIEDKVVEASGGNLPCNENKDSEMDASSSLLENKEIDKSDLPDTVKPAEDSKPDEILNGEPKPEDPKAESIVSEENITNSVVAKESIEEKEKTEEISEKIDANENITEQDKADKDSIEEKEKTEEFSEKSNANENITEQDKAENQNIPEQDNADNQHVTEQDNKTETTEEQEKNHIEDQEKMEEDKLLQDDADMNPVTETNTDTAKNQDEAMNVIVGPATSETKSIDVKQTESNETQEKKDETAETNLDTTKTDEAAMEAPVTLENNDNKRKLNGETDEDLVAKKPKLDGKPCIRPRGVKRVYKGATFWPSNLRQKLCTCNECISMYKDLAVLFLIDPEDTVNAYEALGKEISEGPSSQYEKGLQALSSLDRVQQINALTEYNKMRDKLLDFLKGYKDRKEIVKEEDIKSFFAGMKPKREPDGVYFCR